MAAKVQFFYDVLSPYSFYAFEAILDLKKKWNLDLQLKPFYLAGVMKATGNHGPAEVAAKAKYARLDIQRNNLYFGMNLQPPPKFPSDTLLAQRVLGVLARNAHSGLVEATRCFWKTYWCNGKDISSSDVLVAALQQAGFSNADAQALITQATTEAAKDYLRENTDYAIEMGAFGAPYFVVTYKDRTQVFFGSDRFHHIAMFIDQEYDFSPKGRL